MTTNKREMIDIDESLLLSSIKESDIKKPMPEPVESEQEETEIIVQQEKPKASVQRKRVNAPDYGSVFLQKNELKTRKCVYISQQIHATISEIVRVIAKDVTVGGYIDNVLLQHLEMHRDEINELYKKDRKDLIP